MQATAERRLQAPARKRRDLLRQLAEVEAELKVRILDAAEVGLTHRYIAKVTDVPHPTVSRWVREARGNN
jgi:DNA-directed RNA polymerase specialized sigma24 family protein